MTTTPDPKTVREIAKSAMGYALRQCRDAAVEAALLAGTTAPVLGREFDELSRAVIAEYDRMAAGLPWPDKQPQDPQPWPRAQRMPLAIAGQHVQPWHMQAVAAYDEATGNTTVPRSNLPGMYAAAQVNQAIMWWNERADAEQPQDERDAQLADLATELDAANDNADEIADQRAEYRTEIMRLRARVRELEAAQDVRPGDMPTCCDALPAGWIHGTKCAALEARDAKGK